MAAERYVEFEDNAGRFFDSVRRYGEAAHESAVGGELSLGALIGMRADFIPYDHEGFSERWLSPDLSDRPSNPNPFRAITHQLKTTKPLLVPYVGDLGVEKAWLLPAEKSLSVTCGVGDTEHFEYTNAGRGLRSRQLDLQSVTIPEQTGVLQFAVTTADTETAPLLGYKFRVVADEKLLVFSANGKLSPWRTPEPVLETGFQYASLGKVLSGEEFQEPGQFEALPPTWQLEEFLTNEPPTLTLTELIKSAQYAHAYDTNIMPKDAIPEALIEKAVQGLRDVDQSTSLRRSPLGSQLQVRHRERFINLGSHGAPALEWLFRGIELSADAQAHYDLLIQS